MYYEYRVEKENDSVRVVADKKRGTYSAKNQAINTYQKEGEKMMATETEVKREVISLESEKQETSEFMNLLKDMNSAEKQTIKGIMLGLRLSRATA